STFRLDSWKRGKLKLELLTLNMGLIDSIRRWIDGETADDVLEEADEHTRPRRVWEEFLVKIAREVEAVMQREMFTPPGGQTSLQGRYFVYLMPEAVKN